MNSGRGMGEPKSYHIEGAADVAGPIVLLIGLAFVWTGVNAFWGLTGASQTAASHLLASIAPLEFWATCSLAILILFAAISAKFSDQRMLIPFCMMIAYVAGVGGAEYAQNWIDPKGPILHRLFYLYTAFPMIAVWFAFPERRAQYPLRIGGWSAKNPKWPLSAAVIFFVAIAILFIRLAMDLGYVSFDRWPQSGTIVALSTLNGFTEELLFRGLMFPALVVAVGLRWGIILQALLFGFIHLGSSQAWIGELIAALYLVPLGAFFAYGAYARNGLAWVAGLHAAIDVIGLSLIRLPHG